MPGYENVPTGPAIAFGLLLAVILFDLAYGVFVKVVGG